MIIHGQQLVRLLSLPLVIYQVTGWHDLTNLDYHCWPFGADESNPEPFASCVGVDVDWIHPPPKSVSQNEPFTVNFSLSLTSEFYDWAVQDAKDNLKKNFFMAKNGSMIANNSADAQSWCEQTRCPLDCSLANQDNCCLHHVNIHSCPIDEVKNGLCGPWLPPKGEFYTHTTATCATAQKTAWTVEVSGLLPLHDGHSSRAALIAHFKVATMHVALHWDVLVTPTSVCGDNICHVDNEDCTSCKHDCGDCLLLSNTAIIIIVTVISIILVFTSFIIGYFRCRGKKVASDDNWVISFSEIKPAYKNTLNLVYGASLVDLQQYDSKENANIPVVFDDFSKRNSSVSQLCFGTYNEKLYVLKWIYKGQFKLTKQVNDEIKQVRSLSHINLMPFVGVCMKVPNIIVLSLYCPKGNIYEVVKSGTIPVNWSFLFSFANDIITGLAYLHSLNLVHGRLKAQNCLIDDRWTVKLSDYSLHNLYTPDSMLLPKCAWQSVEIDDRPSYEADMLHYGVIMIQLAMRFDLPDYDFRGLANLKMEWKNHMTRNYLPADGQSCPYPREYNMVVEKCLNENSSLRASAATVKKQLRALNSDRMTAVDNMMMMMEKYSKHLEQLVAEKTNDLMIEKRKTDDLLNSMLPKQVANDLRLGRPVNADSFDSCSIYFSDIVGFTEIAGEMKPLEVVFLLNELYSCFDNVIDRHDVYKVETIGDAYMVVSGVPIRNGDKHAIHIANLALDLLAESIKFKIPNRPNDPLRIRIGLHSGPVCAGVVGLKMPRYCLFGDVVNTASRMESTGEACRIHMSDCIKTLVEKYINELIEPCHMVQRGTINVKGKGTMTTWWLETLHKLV